MQQISFRVLFGLLLALLVSACIAPDGAPLVNTPLGGEETSATAACPEASADTLLLRHDVYGYCLLYPVDYEVNEQPVGYAITILAPATSPGHRERLMIGVEDAAGRSVEEAANQVVADYSIPGLELEIKSDLQIGGEPALLIDQVPGQDFTRRLLFVHDGLLYHLIFMPSDPQQAAPYAEMEALFASVLSSFTFIPAARYSGAPGLVWQGQVESEQGGQCQQLQLFRNADALVGPCDGPGEPAQLGSNHRQQWPGLLSIFGPFEIETPTDQVTFYGSGQTASVAWQHAIIAWARTTYQELVSGQVSAAGNTVLSWWLGEAPEHPGYCDHLLVLVYGYAYIRVEPCGGGEPIALAESWLQTDELEPFDAWLYQYAPLYQDDNYFAGLGDATMSESEAAELAAWAQQVYTRIELATPSYLEAAAADALGPTGRIVFGSRRSGDMDIYSMAVDGSDLRQLSTGETFDAFPAPAPDGSRIAFVAETLDSQRTPVERDIWLVNPDGSGLTNLTAYPGLDMEPTWSPDSQRLAFSSTRDGDGSPRSLYSMAADGSDLHLLVENANQPAWSPAGDQIAFVQDGQIVLYGVADGATTQLTDEPAASPQASANGNPVWSPDGSQLLFVTNRDGNSEIYRMNGDGSEQINLTNQPGYEDSPVWSPDGKWIAFTSDRNAEPGIYVMPSDGSSAVKLTDGALAEFLPTWSPDSNWLAFVSDPAAQTIMRANVAEMLRVGRVTPEPLTTGGDTFPVWMP